MKLLNLSLRNRLFTILVGVWLVLLMVPALVLHLIAEPHFLELERARSIEDLRRVDALVEQELEQLEQVTRDYATWDDLYEYVRWPSAEFEKRNLVDVPSNLHVDLVQVFDANHRAIYSVAMDFSKGVRHTFAETNPDVLSQRFELLGTPLDRGSFKSLRRVGTYRLTDGRLIQLVTYPILRSDGRGPVAGFMVLGRLVADKHLRTLRNRAGLPLELEDPGPSRVPTDDAPAIERGKVTVSHLWRDPRGRPIARLRIVKEATVWAGGVRVIYVAIGLFMAIISLVFAASIWGVQVVVVRPVMRLTSAIGNIRETGMLKARVAIRSDDEIGVLGKAFNEMMDLLAERTEKLQALATLDELTQVFNRRSILEAVHEEIERGLRYDQQFSVMLFDVDHFKRINDTLGHAMGDRVLRRIGKLLRDTLRQSDKVGRYGGEEFLIVLPGQDEFHAAACAERVRAAMEAIDDQGVPWSVTLSIGVAAWDGHTRETLLYVADHNLYRAKHQGRNRVVVGQPPELRLPVSSAPRLHIGSKRPAQKDTSSQSG